MLESGFYIQILSCEFRIIGHMTPSAIHFVGFTGDDYYRAIRVWGLPDYIHRYNDSRFISEYQPGDLVIFANGAESRYRARFAHNDSAYL